MPAVYYFAIRTAQGPSSHAGAGLGLMLLFYPIPSLILMTGTSSANAFLSHIITGVAVLIAVLQFPFYGFVISYARVNKSMVVKGANVLVWIHIIVIAVVITIALIRELI